jgi:hypothetical protein
MLRIVTLSMAVLIALSSGASARRPTRLAEVPAPARIEITPLLVDFGRLDAGTTAEVPGALTIRVYSAQPWALMIAPMRSAMTGESVAIPVSRIEYRAGGSTAFVPLTGPAELMRGGPTTEGGTVVPVDLRFAPRDDDGAGRFDAEIEFILLPQAG